VRLDKSYTSLQEPQEWHTIASRPRRAEFADSAGGNTAIEAPFIFRKNNYYYLFVSTDYCCRGEKSTYKVVMGRSTKITGPYLDKAGVSLNNNGGSVLVQGDGKRWFAAGHNAVCNIDGQDFFVCHGYDATDKGKSKLIIRALEWDGEAWPTLIL
jgi:arabinan endo-1,5-alpha-L-arabinosidase